MNKIFSCLFAAALLGSATHSSAQTIFFEDFTTVTPPALPTGWTNTFTAVAGTSPQGWVTTTAAADYFFNHYTAPHSQYAECTEYYHTGNDPANLTSPTFSLAGTTNPYLSFDYLFNGSHYYSGSVGYFEETYIQISTDGGATWNNIDTLPVGGSWNTRYIDLSAYAGSPNCKINFQYTDSGGTLLGTLLSNVRVFNSQPDDIALTSVTPTPGTPFFVATTSSTPISGVMTNLSPSTVSSFSVTYQAGTGTPVTSTFSGLSIAPMATYLFTCTTPFTPTVLNSVPVKIWVTETGDPAHTNDTMVTNVTGVTHFPVNKPVAEEATATWCDACPEGIVAMYNAEKELHSAISLIAVHCSIATPDPMTDWNYGPWIQSQIPSYPYLLFDRQYDQDPTGVTYLYSEHSSDFAYADVSMSLTYTDTSITVPVTIVPATNLSGSYKLALVLTEDSVHSNSTPSDWDQENLYAGGSSGPMADSQYDFAALPNPVPATTMYYDNVERSITPNAYGGSYLPATMSAGTTYTHTFTAPLLAGWKKSNMHAIVMLIDSTTGYILNSDNAWLSSHTTGIHNTPGAVTHLLIYPNPATTSLTISANEKIKTITISNMLGQTIYKQLSDAQVVHTDVTNLAPGIYLVTINNNETRKFIKK